MALVVLAALEALVQQVVPEAQVELEVQVQQEVLEALAALEALEALVELVVLEVKYKCSSTASLPRVSVATHVSLFKVRMLHAGIEDHASEDHSYCVYLLDSYHVF